MDEMEVDEMDNDQTGAHATELDSDHRILTRLLDRDPEFPDALPSVLIEGTQSALAEFAEAILHHAQDPEDCKFHFKPDGIGACWFMPGSKLGFYIHILPCWNDELASGTAIAPVAEPTD